MRPPADTPRDLADRMVRRSLQQPENLRDFLRYAVPDLGGGLVCERARLLDREFFQEEWRRREADLPFEIPYRTAEEQSALVYVLIEHQSDTDPLMPLRMLYFIVGYWDRQWRTWEGLPPPRPRLELAPVLPIGRPDAAGSLEQRALLNSGGAWLQFLAVMRVEHEATADFLAVFGPALQHLAALHDNETVRWRDLLNMVLRYALARPADGGGDVAGCGPEVASGPSRRGENHGDDDCGQIAGGGARGGRAERLPRRLEARPFCQVWPVTRDGPATDRRLRGCGTAQGRPGARCHDAVAG
jgi:hypothetical protein